MYSEDQMKNTGDKEFLKENAPDKSFLSGLCCRFHFDTLDTSYALQIK